ncbi:cob(I)yrinic acid a,c-diamide adenosyltransferase [Candidatus Thorarchaeota archaeon]|nr:MAG: cob(I)yrinic acid a,c-diamide adenosyltransferase [Candidatus Thorarchaeota archaeon]
MAERIWTGKGDDGTTGLFTGERVKKHSTRVEAYGTVDELISSLGIAKTHNDKTITEELEKIQQVLFRIAAELASGNENGFNTELGIHPVSSEEVEYLEQISDNLWQQMPPLSNFLIPGESEADAFLHHARTICRRAERRIIALSEEADLNPVIVRYINRLSDFIFTLARWANFEKGTSDRKISRDGIHQ